MKTKMYSLVAVMAFVVMGLTLVSFTADTNNDVKTELSVDGDCDKCKDAKCDGKCESPKTKKSTKECKKKCNETHKAAESETTEKKAPAKKACCESKAGCGSHK